MKRWILAATSMVLLIVPFAAHAGGGGYYTWFLSFSNTADEPTGPDPNGVISIYLWLNEGCNPAPEGGGISAAEMKVFPSGTSPWTVITFTPSSGWFNLGSGGNLLLAVGGCPAGPVVAGALLVNAAGPGGLRMGLGDSGQARTVDCSPSSNAWSWPEFVRFRGCQSVGSAFTLQDHGNGCATTAVEESSWGSVKSLYR